MEAWSDWVPRLVYSARVCACYVTLVVSNSATPGAGAGEAPLSMGFSSQEYLSGLPSSPPGDLLNQGIGSTPLMYPTLADGFFTTSATWEALCLLPIVNSSPCHTVIILVCIYIYITCWGIVAHPYRVFGRVAPSKACSIDLSIQQFQSRGGEVMICKRTSEFHDHVPTAGLIDL